MDRPPLHYQTITALADAIRKGEITSTQLVQNLLDRIKSLDGRLNAFRVTCPERALEQAHAADRQIRDGKDSGILHGIPYAVKDLFDVWGCRPLPDQAFSKKISRCRCPCGPPTEPVRMILLGKTNTVQFATAVSASITITAHPMIPGARPIMFRAVRAAGPQSPCPPGWCHWPWGPTPEDRCASLPHFAARWV